VTEGMGGIECAVDGIEKVWLDNELGFSGT
jgi:hypothetical protein